MSAALDAQGDRSPGDILNFDNRRKIDERISLTLTGHDIFSTAR